VEVPHVGFALRLFLACSASRALAFPASRLTWLNFHLLKWRNTFSELEQDHFIQHEKARTVFSGAVSHCSWTAQVPCSDGVFPWKEVLHSGLLLCPSCPPYTTQILQTQILPPWTHNLLLPHHVSFSWMPVKAEVSFPLLSQREPYTVSRKVESCWERGADKFP